MGILTPFQGPRPMVGRWRGLAERENAMTSFRENASHLALLIGMILGAASPTYAVDGVLEINQACAVNTGCFAGDTAGFPVEITQPGSYTLTGSLDLNSEPVPANATGLLVSADFVSIDLNGFSIIGPYDCSGGPPGEPGTGDGIRATGSHTHVRNGIVRGVGRDALSLGADATVDSMTINCSGRDGVRTGERARATSSHITRCAGVGLNLGPGSAFGGNDLANNSISVLGASLVPLSTNACDANTFCQLGDGAYTSSPTLSYFCNLGIFRYDITEWTFTDLGGGTLQVTGNSASLPVPALTGTLPTSGGAFSVSATVPGICIEDYSLSGMFSDSNNWTGTFGLTFTDGGGGCVDCTNQINAVAGSRQ